MCLNRPLQRIEMTARKPEFEELNISNDTEQMQLQHKLHCARIVRGHCP